ncbi:MAG: DUF429 domain-containing protein [Acetobacteraceae bacterium]
MTHGRAVLGIDAAWTVTQPSGVALVVEGAEGWRLLAVQPSYGQFLAAADRRAVAATPAGGAPDAAALLAACAALHAGGADVVAVDMPLSREPIAGRRVSDNCVSRAYGARHCGTHTPSAVRPGAISDALRAGFFAAGYPLATAGLPARALMEVYPHPALVELAGAARRLPYKLSRIGQYWPELSPAERKLRLLATWAGIVAMLEREIAGVAAALLPPMGTGGSMLKAYEDQLDAVVCAWVGICALEGTAEPFGDTVSAIWVPRSRSAAEGSRGVEALAPLCP